MDYLSLEESYNTFTARAAVELTTQAQDSKAECYYDYIHDSIIEIYKAIREATRHGQFTTSVVLEKFYFSRRYKEGLSMYATFERICKEIAQTFEDKGFSIMWTDSNKYEEDPHVVWSISW